MFENNLLVDSMAQVSLILNDHMSFVDDYMITLEWLDDYIRVIRWSH